MSATPEDPPNERTIGQIAFEAYSAYRDGKAFNGEPIPAWEKLESGVRDAWGAAAFAVLAEVID